MGKKNRKKERASLYGAFIKCSTTLSPPSLCLGGAQGERRQASNCWACTGVMRRVWAALSLMRTCWVINWLIECMYTHGTAWAVVFLRGKGGEGVGKVGGGVHRGNIRIK